MLKIENIGRIVGMSVLGRPIVEAGDYSDSLRPNGDTYFVFRIEKQNDGKDYNKAHDIVLSKKVDLTGKYYMFNMGLEMTTGIHIDINDIKKPNELAYKIRNVLVKTQTYYN